MTDFSSSFSQSALPRRTFLRAAGATAATAGLALAGCGSSSNPTPAASLVLSFGADKDTDKQVLNYLFFIKQLEFAFYDKVIAAFPSDMPAAEQAYVREMREHELVHRQVLGNLLGTGALSALPFNFSSVTLTNRNNVLTAAKKLEDTASGAFLGILPRLVSTTLFTLGTKISSVEARHAAFISDLLVPGSFASADVVGLPVAPAGRAVALSPKDVATVLAPFLPTLTINTDSLPTA